MERNRGEGGYKWKIIIIIYIILLLFILLLFIILYGVVLFNLDRDWGKHGLANIIGGETPRFNNITI